MYTVYSFSCSIGSVSADTVSSGTGLNSPGVKLSSLNLLCPFFNHPLEDSTDVGEEDSFLGQTSANAPASSSTFSYFSSPATTSDPFASIGQSPCPPSALSAAHTASGAVSAPNSISMAPTPPPPAFTGSQINPPPQVFGGAVYQSPVGRHTPPPTTMTPPPPQMQPQSHNPYRHTPTSSRASPYIPAPEILPPAHTPQQNPYALSSPPQMFPPPGPTFSTVVIARPHFNFCSVAKIMQCNVSDHQTNSNNLKKSFLKKKKKKLFAEYKKAISTNQWHRRLEFPSGETIVMHNPKVIVQFQPSSVPDEWGTTQDGQTRPRVVKRGIDDDHDEVPDGELPTVDHLVFMVHGIGPVCDLRFRSMIECRKCCFSSCCGGAGQRGRGGI
uniref:SEC23-DDH2 WWE domain-containing protein n=1 Tax=Fundulus heteroclitus TaxID=8078 RepID=A0A3Q2TC44_FUNHE